MREDWPTLGRFVFLGLLEFNDLSDTEDQGGNDGQATEQFANVCGVIKIHRWGEVGHEL